MKTMFIILILSLTGCATVGITPLGQTQYEPKDSECKIDVYLSPESVPHKYEEVCLIDSKTGYTMGDERTAAEAIRLSKPAACKCGADAIIVQSAGIQNTSMSMNNMGTAIVKAIKYVK